MTKVSEITSRAIADMIEYYKPVGGKIEEIEAQLVNIVQYDITKYGADKTGATYSDEALEKIIPLLTDGCKVTFPFGRYKFQNTHIIDKNVEIDFNNSIIETSGQEGLVFTGVLKSTHFVTSDYIETTSKNSVVLDNTDGIAVGDLINVVSSELYDTSRAYYFKGGNAVITKIVGNTVYFNLKFPFNMAASSLVVNVYKPITVRLKNVTIKSTASLSNSLMGIQVSYGKDCVLKNINTDNYQYNIDIYRCVNCRLEDINTGHAESTGDTHDGYGIAIESSTNIVCSKIVTNSGQHGITTTGREVSFNLKFNDCILKAEIWSLGFGAHANVFNTTFDNCVIHGFLLAGNTVMNNCTVLKSELTSHVNSMTLGESTRYSNYVFNNCIIEDVVQTSDAYQVESLTRDKVGKIIFNNCPDVTLVTSVKNDSTYGKIADIGYVEFNKCQGFKIRAYDKIKKLNIIDSESVNLTDITVQHNAVNSLYEKINEVYIVRTKLPLRFTSVLLNNCDKVVFDCVSFNTVTAGLAQGSISVNNAAELVFINCDMSNAAAERGLDTLSGIGKLVVVNSKIKFRTATALKNNVKNPTVSYASFMTDIDTNEAFDVITATDGRKYKRTIDSTGNQILTVYS